jgi:LPXTG-motif cell wall-anchored protein
MLKFRLAAVATLVAVFGLVSVSPASAQYAPCSVTLDVDPNSLEGSGSVDGHATSDLPGSWTASNDFNGQTDNGSGDTFDFSFSFPKVNHKTDVTISVLLVRDDNVTCEANETITLRPEGDDDDDDDDGDGKDKNGALPDTGGSDQGVIGAGLTLLLIGGGALFLSRRRNEDTA